MSHDLSGEWIGNYSYPGELEPVPFEASLFESNGQLTGETKEPGHTLDMGETAHALIHGSRTGGHVTFTKVYDTIEHEPILYDGTVDETGTEIQGHWTIVGEWSGSFLMRRPAAAELDVEAEEEVAA